MDTNNNQPELVSQACIDRWRAIYARKQLIRRAPYWAWDRQGNHVPITDIVDTLQPATILDYGSGNGRGGEILRTRSQQERVSVTSYDPAWPGFERVPTGQYDLVIAYNMLNDVEPAYRDRVCNHIQSLVGRDLILAIVVPLLDEPAANNNLMTAWISHFPQLLVSYTAIGYPEGQVSLTDKPIKFVTLFAWLYREPPEVVPPTPRVRLKKKGT